MTDQEREAKIRAYWDERDDRAFLLRRLDAERERVQALEDAAVEASSLAYLAKTHIGLGEYDIARDKALGCYSILQRAIIAEPKP